MKSTIQSHNQTQLKQSLLIENLGLKNRLEDVTINAQAGQIVHLMGGNGAGKSSLLHLLAGLERPHSGHVQFLEQDIHQANLTTLATFRGFQEQHQSTNFPIKVSESLSFFAQFSTLPQMLEQALEIESFLTRPLMTLSGGESRRVHVARVLLQIWPAITNGNALILLDEPTQGLDFRHQHLLFELLRKLARMGNTIVVSHHDLNLCYPYAHQVWLLKSGQLLAAGECHSVMTQSILEQVFDCKINQLDTPNSVMFQTSLR